jgi:hypothetical protein
MSMAVRPSELVRPVRSWLTRLQLPLVFGVAALGAAGLVGVLPGRVTPDVDLPLLAWPFAILGVAAALAWIVGAAWRQSLAGRSGAIVVYGASLAGLVLVALLSGDAGAVAPVPLHLSRGLALTVGVAAAIGALFGADVLPGWPGVPGESGPARAAQGPGGGRAARAATG